MERALHLIDERTDDGTIAQLSLLVRRDDSVVSIGPPPAGVGVDRVVPRHVGRLAGRAAGTLAQQVRRGSVIHVWSPSCLSLGARLSRATDSGLVVTLMSSPNARQSDRLANWRDLQARWTVPTAAACDRLAAVGIPAARIHVLAPAAATAQQAQAHRLREQLGLDDDNIVVTLCEPMRNGSGHKAAIWAWAIVRQVHPQVRLLLGGTGPTGPRVRFFAESTGHGDEIHFCGPRFDLAQVMAASQIAISCPADGCGASSLAAGMRAGLPILAVGTADAAELTAAGQGALLVGSGHPRRLAAGLLRLLEEPQLARKLGQAARRVADDKCDPPAVRLQLDRIYAAASHAPAPS